MVSMFPASSLPVPAGTQILLYSDGAYEWTLPDERIWSLSEFIDMCSQHAHSVDDWTLGSLMTELRSRAPAEGFEDDCSMVLVKFD